MLTEVADGCWQTLVQTLAIREDYEKVLKPSGFCFGRGPTCKCLANIIFVGINGSRRERGEPQERLKTKLGRTKQKDPVRCFWQPNMRFSHCRCRGQIGHLQVPHGMLKAGDCDRTAN